MLEPVIAWNSLTQGRVFGPITIVLDDASIDAYLAATGETHPLYRREGGGYVPPLYTTLVRFVKSALGGRWPSGTVQLDHHLSMRRALRRGETLRIDARVGSSSERKGRGYYELCSTMRDPSGAIVGEQSTSSIWGEPLAVADAADLGSAARAPAGAASAPASDASGGGGRSPSPPKPADRSPPSGLHEGPRLGPLEQRFEMPRVRAFGEVAAARDPIHLDPGFAATTRYRVNIVQGRLAMTLVSRLMLEHAGLRWLESGGLSLRFVAPVLVGERIRAWAAPLDTAGRRYQVCCENDRGEPVIVGEASLGG